MGIRDKRRRVATLIDVAELECTKIFGQVRGAEIVELVERTTGQPCPCKQGRPCPLVEALSPLASR
jgi:hypothetical protein